MKIRIIYWSRQIMNDKKKIKIKITSYKFIVNQKAVYRKK